MLSIPQNKDEFVFMAMKSYDICTISLDEFRKDLRIIRKINKELTKWKENPNKTNVRLLLNMFLISFNQFGETAVPLIFYKMSEENIQLSCMFISKLGRRNDLVDKHQVSVDLKLLDALNNI